ncbi:MAG: HlyC/CorC family transporter [Gammaproteobacteria bacterium]|nr:HlyC/CorC family transporter [Gammaproteobacteria bacterium]HRX72014.1 HlyC/CorC family transporter [Candidatus Competibacteraceae bacterium]
MDDLHIGVLGIALVLLIGCSAFFSSSETGLMILNRYRLRHLAKAGDKAAQRTSKLLERPDRLIGIILLGNNFINVLASSLATILAIHFLGEAGIAVSTVVLTLVLLVFGEVAPKTLAALHPEKIAFPASAVLAPLLKLFYPLVWLTNTVANSLLRLFRVAIQTSAQHSLSAEELRTVVLEAGVMIPKRHQTMLLSILELEEITVEDIMIPRNEVAGLDLEDDWDVIIAQLTQSPYSRLVAYRDTIDQVVGFVHLRKALNLMAQKPDFNRADLEGLLREPYFIPEGASLTRQLVNFQQLRRRFGLVVDEYGDVKGLITLEDILEEIVGEFTTDPAAVSNRNLAPRADGGYVVSGRTSIRNLNRMLEWKLPTDGPRTLNGLIMEHLEAIPEPGARLTLAGHPTEIVEITGNRVKTAVIWPNPEPETEGGGSSSQD